MNTKYIVFSLIVLAGHACWGASWEEKEAREKRLAQEFLEKHKGNRLAAIVDAAKNNIPEAINYLAPEDVRALASNYAVDFGRHPMIECLIKKGAIVTNQEDLDRIKATTVAGEGVAGAELSAKEKVAQAMAQQIEDAIKNGDQKIVNQLAMVALTVGDLPNELITHIAEFLDPKFLMRLVQVNQQFKAIATEVLAKKMKIAAEPFIVKHGGDLQAAFFDAAKNNNPWVIYYLLRLGVVDVNVADAEGWTALMLAAMWGHNKVVAQLIQAGALVNAANNKNGTTALIAAASNGHNNVVAQLLQAKADVNAANVNNVTALMWAALWGHNNVVAQLLQAKADVNAVNSSGSTALRLAAMHGHNDVVAQLIRAGADVNVADNNGTTTLMWIAELDMKTGTAQVIQTLLDNGADVNVTNENGETALDIAWRRDATEIIQILENWKPHDG